MSIKNIPTKQADGFTLIEVLVISPILILIITGILGLLVNLTSSNLVSNGNIDLAQDNKTALSFIEDDIKLSPQFLTTIDPGLSDPYGSDNNGATWSYNGSSTNVRTLVARTYSTSSSVKSPDRRPVYINTYGCDEAVLPSSPVLTNNKVYFVRGGNLYRRTLTDESQNLCNTQYQRQSCPIDVVSPRNTICKADDTLLMSGVTKFDVQYYANSGDATPLTVYGSTDPGVLDTAKAVVVTLGSSQVVAGETLSYESSLRISRLNL